MRLNALHENQGQADWSFLKDVFDDKEYAEIVRHFGEMTKSFKFSHSEVKENSGVVKGFFFYFTNTFLDLQLYINANHAKDKDGASQKYMMVNIEAKVHDRYLISGKGDNQNVLIRAMEFINDNDISKFEAVAKRFQKVVNDFIDWYFEISGEYGKVKLFSTTYNVIDGYSRGGENRFIAIAGDYHCETDLSKDQSDTRVF